MKVTKVPMSAWRILPPAKDKCQECAVAHPPEMPHDATSLYWMTKWKIAHDGEEGTWADAMEHCSLEMRGHWISELKKLGIDIHSTNTRGNK